MNASEKPKPAQQRYAPTYAEHTATQTRLPPQLLELPTGWVEARHVPGFNIGIVASDDGADPCVMLLSYAEGTGDQAGAGMFNAMPLPFAREVAASINRMCDAIASGHPFAGGLRRPPAKPQADG